MSAEPAPRPLIFPLQRIPAKASLRPKLELPDYLPARMLNEFVYCQRLFFCEWVEGVLPSPRVSGRVVPLRNQRPH